MAEDAHAAGGNRAHRQFPMARHAELAHDEDVERRVELRCHFKRNGQAATRETQHEHVLAVGVPGQLSSQQSAGLDTVSKQISHSSSL